MRIRMTLVLMTLSATGLLSGCHGPGGAFMHHTGQSQTFHSTERLPKSVTITDTRTNEVVFQMEIPVGQQLTFNFLSDRGDDSLERPDLMQYELFPINTRFGRLTNSMSVPNSTSRRIDVDFREPGEFAAQSPETRYQTEPPRDARQRGSSHQDDGLSIYDH